MSQMNCSEVTARLDAYLADRLEGTELQGMIAHLAGCREMPAAGRSR